MVRALHPLLFVIVSGCSAEPLPRTLAAKAIVETPMFAVPTPTTATEAKSPAVPALLACIVHYYDATARLDGDAWSLVLPSGQTIPYTEVAEVYEIPYPHGAIKPVTEVDFDPGRVRIDALMFATYGRSAKEVQAALTQVKIGGKVVLVHEKIAEPLRRVAARIAEAMKHDRALAPFFESLGGTFNWRKIAGTDELSMHAWAIAIDLDTARANYWRNAAQFVWKNQYPQAIVDAFEAEGFVWGGRWYHYDTMHFEYRPELLDPGCYPPRGNPS
jgi:hypothetical protein